MNVVFIWIFFLLLSFIFLLDSINGILILKERILKERILKRKLEDKENIIYIENYKRKMLK